MVDGCLTLSIAIEQFIYSQVDWKVILQRDPDGFYGSLQLMTVRLSVINTGYTKESTIRQTGFKIITLVLIEICFPRRKDTNAVELLTDAAAMFTFFLRRKCEGNLEMMNGRGIQANPFNVAAADLWLGFL